MMKPVLAMLSLRLHAASPRVHALLRHAWWRLRTRRPPPGTDGAAAHELERYLHAVAAVLPPPKRVTGARPPLHLILPLRHGDDDAPLRETVESLRAQRNAPPWVLHVCGPVTPAQAAWLHALATDEPCIRHLPDLDAVTIPDDVLHIVSLVCGTRLHADALAHFDAALAAHPGCELLYADDHAVDPTDGRALDARCKPVFDPVRLLGENYIGDTFVIGCALLDTLGGPALLANGDVRHRLLQAVAARIDPRNALHLPLFLHCRAGSAANGDGAPPARAPVVSTAAPAETTGISVIIPSRDGMPHLQHCIDGVLAEFADGACCGEIIVVDNQSRQPEMHDYLRRLQQSHAEMVRVLRHDAAFNYSAINNRAVRQARFDTLLLLNDDVAPLQKGWLRAMARWLVHPGVGAVGARLLYPDGRVQHAGVVLGMGGIAGHAGAGLRPGEARLQRLGGGVTRSVSAVTAACLLTRKALYWEVGGLNEDRLRVAFNDVDFCLKIRSLGWRIVCTPEATLTHLESVSRGSEDTLSKQRRFAIEITYMQEQWGDCLGNDAFYNPNLSLMQTDLSFRIPVAARALQARAAGIAGAVRAGRQAAVSVPEAH